MNAQNEKLTTEQYWKGIEIATAELRKELEEAKRGKWISEGGLQIMPYLEAKAKDDQISELQTQLAEVQRQRDEARKALGSLIDCTNPYLGNGRATTYIWRMAKEVYKSQSSGATNPIAEKEPLMLSKYGELSVQRTIAVCQRDEAVKHLNIVLTTTRPPMYANGITAAYDFLSRLSSGETKPEQCPVYDDTGSNEMITANNGREYNIPCPACKHEHKPVNTSHEVYPGSWCYPLFKHMSDEHGKILTDSELHNIAEVVRKIDGETKCSEIPNSCDNIQSHYNILQILSEISPLRSNVAFGVAVTDWSLPEWGNALAGEVGELCNFIKKSHLDGGDRIHEISKEAADVVIYLDLLCTKAGINLQSAIVQKFNEVSDRMGCTIKFPTVPET